MRSNEGILLPSNNWANKTLLIFNITAQNTYGKHRQATMYFARHDMKGFLDKHLTADESMVNTSTK